MVDAPPGAERRWVRPTLWLLVVLGGLAAVLVARTGYPAPGWLSQSGAVVVSTAYAFGLAVRTGGRPFVAGGLALLVTASAVVSQQPVLLAGATVGTAVVGAILGVLATGPAARFSRIVVEVVLAVLVAVTAAFASQAYRASVSLDRIGYLVLGLALLGALGIVYRLGARLHGLGRRGAIMVVSGIVLLVVSLAYTEALSTWGSPGLVSSLERSTSQVRGVLGAVPRPTEVLVGIPALVWGVSTRARRRQGWWVCAFGAAGLAVVTVTLLNPILALGEAGLSLLYSVVGGLLLGYLVIRADTFLTGPRGRRARRAEEAAAHRPEPGRFQPLL